MFEAGENLDKITAIEWPEPWVLSQRELHRVIWSPPEEDWMEYAAFMLRPPCQ